MQKQPEGRGGDNASHNREDFECSPADAAHVMKNEFISWHGKKTGRHGRGGDFFSGGSGLECPGGAGHIAQGSMDERDAPIGGQGQAKRPRKRAEGDAEHEAHRAFAHGQTDQSRAFRADGDW